MGSAKMTITVTSYRPNRILFCSDTYNYSVNLNILNKALQGEYTFNHKNFKEAIVKIIEDKPKIHKFGKSIGVMWTGDLFYKDKSLLRGLNMQKDVICQLEKRLRARKEKKLTNLSFYAGRFDKERSQCVLDYLYYKNGQIRRSEQYDKGNWRFLSTFSPEIKEIFHRKYDRAFLNSVTDVQISVVHAFFQEITSLYNGLAGGNPIFAVIDKEGFRWI